jgi:hypothetical protein
VTGSVADVLPKAMPPSHYAIPAHASANSLELLVQLGVEYPFKP